MGSRDVWSKSERPAAKKNAGNDAHADRKSKGSSGRLLPGIILLAVAALFVSLIILGALAGEHILRQYYADTADKERGYPPGGMPAAPTIIVRPEVPPNMLIMDKLGQTETIVGQWQSRDVRVNGYTGPADNFNLTVYNDSSFIIYDRQKDTYIIGEWIKLSSPKHYTEYSVVEPGKAGPVSIIGHFSSLQFQYNYHGPGQSPDYGYISYVRTNYSGVFDNL